jgi:hypothetical protein
MVATTLNGSGLFQYEQRLGDPDPFGNFPEARLNEAAFAADAFACRVSAAVV